MSVLALFCLTGCDAPPQSGDVPPGTVAGDVWTTELRDGTRCVAWKYGRAGGLDCDFPMREVSQ